MNKFFLSISFVLALLFLASCGKEGEQQLTDTERSPETSPAISTPAAPTGVAAIASEDKITVTWNPAQGVTSYTVYYSEKPGLETVQGERITGITSTSCEHAKANKGTMYYYVVTASNGNGESPPSTESGAMLQSLPPATPTGVAASGGDEKITLRWNAVTGAKFYNLYYATATGIARAKGKKVSGINTAFYQHTDVKNKTMYYYVVSAVNNEGESPASNETGAMP